MRRADWEAAATSMWKRPSSLRSRAQAPEASEESGAPPEMPVRVEGREAQILLLRGYWNPMGLAAALQA
ncbi:MULTISPECIES: hypothetical protein [Microbispora]|uniref:hypothetical protein n=1 Tax=Microbispora TaxID=2005 RepID=UPI001952EC1A|nr:MULTISPECIES: hypothetical protein [Microbispora]